MNANNYKSVKNRLKIINWREYRKFIQIIECVYIYNYIYI